MIEFFKNLLGFTTEAKKAVVELEQKVEAVVKAEAPKVEAIVKEEIKKVAPKIKETVKKVDEVIDAEVKKVRAKKRMPKAED